MTPLIAELGDGRRELPPPQAGPVGPRGTGPVGQHAVGPGTRMSRPGAGEAEATSLIMAVAITVGTRFPTSATSMGRVLLAGHDDRWLRTYLERVELRPLTRFTVTDPAELRTELARAREQGYAIVDQELEEGLRSLATPIRDGSGRVIASVNVPAHANRSPIEDVRRDLLPALLDTTTRIEADLASVARRDSGL